MKSIPTKFYQACMTVQVCVSKRCRNYEVSQPFLGIAKLHKLTYSGNITNSITGHNFGASRGSTHFPSNAQCILIFYAYASLAFVMFTLFP